MDKEIKTFKRIHGYTEWKDIGKYVHSLKNGFKYYYEGEYQDMKPVKYITFNKISKNLSGKFGWLSRSHNFKGRIQKILWPACNSTKPIVFFNHRTLHYG